MSLLVNIFKKISSFVLRFEKNKQANLNNFKILYSKYKVSFKECSSLVTVIIPVYNGFNHLIKLIPSLLRNTSIETKIIIIDDCSSDCRINLYLKKLSNFKNIKIITNKINLGFVASINMGMEEVFTPYVIWLNSDTVVPKNWVNKMIYPFILNKKIASTTPFTNSGTVFSFPNFGENNNPFDDIELINSALEHIKFLDLKRNYCTTGVGFCMALKMEAWKDNGPLNEKLFGKGYGEENDWCYRAIKKGWKHSIALNLYIHHFHGGSFSATSKRMLSNNHLSILEKKYPYLTLYKTPQMFKKDQWLIYRQLALLILTKKLHYKIILNKKRLYFSTNIDPKGRNSIVVSHSKQIKKWIYFLDDLIVF